MRKHKDVIPLGFWTIQRFLKAGFKIKELIIKRQHNCKTSGFWYSNSIKYNFLLLAHEYLVVFKKDESQNITKNSYNNNFASIEIGDDLKTNLETTTVWIFNKEDWLKRSIANVVKRYSANNYYLFSSDKKEINIGKDLFIGFYDNHFPEFVELAKKYLKKDGFMVIITEDIRLKNNLIFSSAIEIEKILNRGKEFKIKEIVILSIENQEVSDVPVKENLDITHKYLLIYRKVSE